MNTVARTLVVICNPHARRAPKRLSLLHEALSPLVAAGWNVDIQTTDAPGHASVLAERAARMGVEVIAACGGDGTVNEVANGMAGTDGALAVLPAGTANVWAREAGIPRDLGRAARLIPHARRVRVDLGRIRAGDEIDRRFLLMCGVGMDAAAVRLLHSSSRSKRWFGLGTYVAVGAWVMTRFSPRHARVQVDGLIVEGSLLQLIAGNTRLYGGVTRITPAALMDDGLLDVCAFFGAGSGHRAALAARILRGGLDTRGGRGIDYLRGARICVDTDHPMPVQIDGEYLCETPIAIEVDRKALNVLIASTSNPLLRGG